MVSLFSVVSRWDVNYLLADTVLKLNSCYVFRNLK
jgi:hypothetical protein